MIFELQYALVSKRVVVLSRPFIWKWNWFVTEAKSKPFGNRPIKDRICATSNNWEFSTFTPMKCATIAKYQKKRNFKSPELSNDFSFIIWLRKKQNTPKLMYTWLTINLPALSQSQWSYFLSNIIKPKPPSLVDQLHIT